MHGKKGYILLVEDEADYAALICRQFVARHGGRLDLTDTDAPGTAFLIQIPRRGVDGAASEAHG